MRRLFLRKIAPDDGVKEQGLSNAGRIPPVWRRALGLVGRGVAAWMLPQTCFICQHVTPQGALCEACLAYLPWRHEAGCPLCALPTWGGQYCGPCLKRPPSFDATCAVLAYETPLREMVLAMKNQGNSATFALLAYWRQVLARTWVELDWQVDCVVAMPLHRQRLAERGFNQSALLMAGLPSNLPRGRVVRDVNTPHQAGLRLKARQRNVRGVFRAEQSFAGQRVLLVDDVMTSGASLNALARCVKAAGAEWVGCLVLARTGRR